MAFFLDGVCLSERQQTGDSAVCACELELNLTLSRGRGRGVIRVSNVSLIKVDKAEGGGREAEEEEKMWRSKG